MDPSCWMEIYLSILKDHTLGNKRGKSNTICLCFRETKCNKYLFCLISVGLLALKGLSIHFLPLICGSRINQVVLTSLSRAPTPPWGSRGVSKSDEIYNLCIVWWVTLPPPRSPIICVINLKTLIQTSIFSLARQTAWVNKTLWEWIAWAAGQRTDDVVLNVKGQHAVFFYFRTVDVSHGFI